MERLIINGGKPLFGQVEVMSAKNSVLPLLCASILTDEEVVLHKCPKISDVDSMLRILEELGVSIRREGDNIIINASSMNTSEIPTTLAGELRSSIFLLGPIIAKMKHGRVAYPGGCDIGLRPIDIHIKGLKELGIRIKEEGGHIECDGSNMFSSEILLDLPSVGATENLMMASVFLKGRTILRNVAKEPEIIDLQDFLCAMGAKIYGAGTGEIIVEGVERLHGTEYTPIPDRIVAGTYLIAVAMCGGEVELNRIKYEHIYSLISKIRKTTCNIVYKNGRIVIKSNGRPKGIDKIETMYYPGFPTDLQSQMMSLLAVSHGTSLIVENIFETRFNEVSELVKMGANIIVKGNTAIIHGVDSLYGANVVATDLRGGASLVLAGLKANGTTTISKVSHIDRGYECIEEQFRLIGADIKRVY